jgi:hypothetical protein
VRGVADPLANCTRWIFILILLLLIIIIIITIITLPAQAGQWAA